MKKMIVTLVVASSFVLAVHAQQPVVQDKAPVTKEEKEKMKLKRAEEESALYKELALTADQENQVKALLEDSKQKNNAIKKDDSLKEEEKAAKTKAANEEKNNKLKEIMGADKYKLYNAIKKRQREDAASKVAGM